MDYKERMDISSTYDKVELAKDVGAFRALGGHIVIGAEDDGKPSTLFTKVLWDAFDESKVVSMLGSYLPKPVGVTLGKQSIDGHHYVIIHVEPSPMGVAIFTKQGGRPKKKATKGDRNRDEVVFNRGDVFVREGTSSERWHPHNLEDALERVMRERKDAWRRESVDDFADLLKRNSMALNIANGPARLLDASLDEETFENIVVEQVRGGDLVPLELFLERTGPLLERAQADGNEDELELHVDRLTLLGSVAVRLRALPVLASVVDVMQRGYNRLPEPNSTLHDAAAAETRIRYMSRLYGLGALAIRKGVWGALSVIAVRKTSDGRMWLRDAQIWDARSDPHKGTRSTKNSVQDAWYWVREQAWLRRDEPDNDEAVLDSLLRFDLLAAVAVMWASKDGSFAHWYPNFVHFYAWRVEPALEWLIDDKVLRSALEVTEEAEVAEVIRVLKKNAMEVKPMLSSFAGFQSQKVNDFLAANPKPAED